MTNAKRDDNRVTTLIGVSSADGVTHIPIQVNPATGRVLAEGSGVFTEEEVQDVVGAMMTDTSEIDFTYTDATGLITADLKTGSIDILKLDSGVQTSLGLADTALQSETSHADVVVDGDFASNGILKRTSAGVYGIVTDNSSNWDIAFGWGNHASSGYLTSASIDTLAKLNTIITDATLIDTGDSRLSDARTPLAHTHPISTDISGLGTGVAASLAIANNSAGGYSPINGTAVLTNKTIAFGSNTLTNVMSLTTAQSVTAGIKKTFQANATNAGLRLAGVTADPSSLVAGDLWYRSDTSLLSYRGASSVRTVIVDNLGKAGGQTLIGGTASGENLLIQSTSNATKGLIGLGSLTDGVIYNGVNKRLGIGTASPSVPLHISTSTTDLSIQQIDGTITASSSASFGLNLAPTIKPSVNLCQIARMAGVFDPQASISNVYGLNNNVFVGGSTSNNITSLYANFARITKTGTYTGTITHGYNFHSADGSGGITITNQYGFYVGALTTGTNNFGYFSNVESGSNRYNFYASGTADNYLNGNLGIGTTTFGTSATKTLALANGTVPSTSPADMVQLFSVDLSAGNATLGLRTETAVATETVTSDRTLSVRINGATYKILLKS